MATSFFIPLFLTSRRIWALWKLEPGTNGRMSKVPYSALYNGRASSTNPQTWTDYETAVATLNKGVYRGLSIAIPEEEPLIFIDLDHCIGEDGQLSEVAQDVVSHFPASFMEVSQSGKGIHILTLGEVPKSFKNTELGIEVYNRARFCALTGNAIQPLEPTEEQESLDYICEKYGPRKKAREVKTPKPAVPLEPLKTEPLSDEDEDIIHRASRMRYGGQRFSDLYAGRWQDHYGSQSEADLSFCNTLAFWCNRDPRAMNRIFCSSKLFRDKWLREDYRTDTINTAINSCKETAVEYKTRKRIEEINAYEKTFN